MADYRQFCSSCSNEVGFGGHAAGCEARARVRAAEQERRRWEDSVREATRELTDDQVVAALVEFDLRIRALSQEMAAMEKHVMVLKGEALGRGGRLLEEYRKQVEDRG